MTTHVHPVWEPTAADQYSTEVALESLPFVTRACVARHDDRGTVVLVAVDPRATATHPAATTEMHRVLADHGVDPGSTTLRITSGWLPRRDVFPPRIRRSCVRARYAPLLLAGLASLLPLVAGVA